jgi:hypothetical protein
MDERQVLALIDAGGISYAEARPLIKPGDLLFLHHSFVKDWVELSWYDKQIYAVQKFTGPMAHIGILDRIQSPDDDEDRVIVYESVVAKPRAVRLSTTAEQGFLWLPMNRPITAAAREAIWSALGFGDYSKWGAVLAGLKLLPKDEAARSRMWCAKFAFLMGQLYGLRLHESMVPTQQAEGAMRETDAQMQYVRMK